MSSIVLSHRIEATGFLAVSADHRSLEGIIHRQFGVFCYVETLLSLRSEAKRRKSWTLHDVHQGSFTTSKCYKYPTSTPDPIICSRQFVLSSQIV
ncbi:hypothetical protein ARMSODRAFT_346913 [Armillaria solidipes]|uniref:Uncharacterized protein n=1 Tax=Armillaria solidipes TaxID=1076256 RepID=A0A2H3BAY9_9AGAR|nr:hypothetical protein ARMSODRAFT_346913 [Armillaria solidipes]